MKGQSQYGVPALGLADILMYLVPGAVTLLSVGLLVPIPDLPAQDPFGLAASVFGVLLAYFVGHAIYPINYPLRWVLDRWPKRLPHVPPPTAPRKHQSRVERLVESTPAADSPSGAEPAAESVQERGVCDCDDIKCLTWIASLGGACVAELSRCRSLSRFSSAMFIPSIMLGAAVAEGLAGGRSTGEQATWGVWSYLSFALGAAVGIGFCWRYRRYRGRFSRYVASVATATQITSPGAPDGE